jgi:dUTP pyrophosphatase
MKVKIKKLSEKAVIPNYSRPGDAGLDLTATSRIFDKNGNVSYGTDIAIEIPEGHVGLLFPRSSNSKKDLLLTNSVGVIDSNYRGEIFLKFKPSLFYGADEYGEDSEEIYYELIAIPDQDDFEHDYYDIGDKIGQLIIIPYPQIEFEEVEELSTTVRGEQGFGSSGN